MRASEVLKLRDPSSLSAFLFFGAVLRVGRAECGRSRSRPHRLLDMVALKVSAVLMWLVAAGFGLPAPFVAFHLLRERSLLWFMGLFPMYGGGFFDRRSPEAFTALLGLFFALSAGEAFAAWLLWHGEGVGAAMTLALLPVEALFWLGFAVPVPPILAVVRLAALAVGWSSLH